MSKSINAFLRNAGKRLGIVKPTYLSSHDAFTFFATHGIDFFWLDLPFSTGRPKGDCASHCYDIENLRLISTEGGLVAQGIFAYADPIGGGKRDGVHRPGSTHYKRFEVKLSR